MTLSLLSRFNRSPGHVLYLTGGQVSAFEWRNGQIVDAYLFQTGEDGLADFSRYLTETPDVPAYFLVDVVEEEYRRDTIPHVVGSDRKALIEARSKRLFRETTYSTAQIQGRETEGRRDDRILYTALTNPALLAPWMERIRQHKVPLGGIFSLPLLSQQLLERLKIGGEQVLLLSLQSVGNMRQSFFHDGRLKISRLAHLPARGPEYVADAIFDEVEKLRRYLNSLRLLNRETPLEVYLLLHGEVYREVDQRREQTPTTRFHLLDMAEVANQLNMEQRYVSNSADSVFSHFLMQSRPANHYATKPETQYFTLHRMRYALLAVSLLVFIAGLFWSAVEVVDGLVYKQRSVATQKQADYYQQRYEQAKSALPAIPYEPQELKTVVEISEQLESNSNSPDDIMRALSLALNGYPDIFIESIDWRVDTDANAAVGGFANKETSPGEGPGMRYEAELDEGVYHLAYLQGRIHPFNGNYRNALNTVRAFVGTLRNVPGIRQVRILSLPLNVNSNQNLRGDINSEPALDQANFSVRVIFRVQNENA